MDKFCDKNALLVGQDMRANTIALRLKHPVMSLERLCIGREFSLRILVILYSTYLWQRAIPLPSTGLKTCSLGLLSATMCRNFRIMRSKRTISARAMSCGSRHVRLSVWSVPLVLPTCVQCFSCFAMPTEGMRSRYIYYVWLTTKKNYHTYRDLSMKHENRSQTSSITLCRARLIHFQSAPTLFLDLAYVMPKIFRIGQKSLNIR